MVHVIYGLEEPKTLKDKLKPKRHRVFDTSAVLPKNWRKFSIFFATTNIDIGQHLQFLRSDCHDLSKA